MAALESRGLRWNCFWRGEGGAFLFQSKTTRMILTRIISETGVLLFKVQGHLDIYFDLNSIVLFFCLHSCEHTKSVSSSYQYQQQLPGAEPTSSLLWTLWKPCYIERVCTCQSSNRNKALSNSTLAWTSRTPMFYPNHSISYKATPASVTAAYFGARYSLLMRRTIRCCTTGAAWFVLTLTLADSIGIGRVFRPLKLYEIRYTQTSSTPVDRTGLIWTFLTIWTDSEVLAEPHTFQWNKSLLNSNACRCTRLNSNSV